MKNLRRTIPGINDCTTLRPDIAEKFSKDSPIKPSEVTPYSNKKALFDCNKGHSWSARISTVTSGGGCVYCAGLKVLTGFNDLASRYPELLESYSENNALPPTEVYFAGAKYLLWSCKVCRGEWSTQTRNRVNGSGDCPYCCGTKLLKGFNDFATRYPIEAKLWSKSNALTANDVFPFTNKLYFFTCVKHGDWRASPNKICGGTRCPECAKNSFVSRGETELFNFVSHIYEGVVIQSDRNTLDGFEIDVLAPSLNIGFEFNGDYWHSNKVLLASRGVTAEEYHLEKMRNAFSRGVSLYFVWESDWVNCRDLIEESIRLLIEEGSESSILSKLAN